MTVTSTGETFFGIAAGTTGITPEAPLPLARLYEAHEPVTVVSDPLEANAVILRYGNAVCAFLSFDLLYVGTELREAIAAQLADVIPSENLLINASHTHFAPPTDKKLPKLGPVSDAYLSFLVERGAGLVKELLARSPETASLSYVTGPAGNSINRRLPVFGLRRDFPLLRTRWEMRPNPMGPRDDVIRLVSVLGKDGKRLAILWEYSCHPVCFPHTDRISADFPGVVRQALRADYGPIPVVFWQGFSGDVRPRTIRPEQTGLFGIKRPAAFARFTDEGWNAWSGSLAARVAEVSRADSRLLTGGIRCMRQAIPLTALGPDAGGRDLTFQEIALGPDFSVFGMSAEVASGYAARLARSRAPADVIPVGCIDGVTGYLPTSEMIPQGGYEPRGHMKCFGVSNRYRPDVTERVEHLIFDTDMALADS